MTIIPYTPYMTIVRGNFYSYQGKTWEALKNYAKSPIPYKDNTIWREYKVDVRDTIIKEYETLFNTEITKTVLLPKTPYKVRDMIAYIIMQQNNTGGDVEPEPTPNVAPAANAGADLAITLPTDTVTLAGTGTDTDGTIQSYIWSKSSGPELVSFTGTNTATATAKFNIDGTYVFILTVVDNNGASSTDSVTVIVNPAVIVPNTGPAANAGSDNTITLPTSSVQLNGVATDSDGVIASYLWEQTIGPNTAVISNTAIPNPTVSGLIAGTYTFRLTATDDDGATASDTVIITVNPEPAPGTGVTLLSPESTTVPAGLTVPGTSETPPTVYSDNSAPLAFDVRITNEYQSKVGTVLTSAFNYFDAENSAPGTHLYQWYRESKTGTETAITGATSANYLLVNADLTYGIFYEVTPVSSDGVIGIPVRSMRTDYVVAAPTVYPKATLAWTGVSGAITSPTSVIRASSAAEGKARTTQGFTGKGYVRFKNALPGYPTGFGGGKKNSGNYGITYGMEYATQIFASHLETWETGGRTQTMPGPVFANSYIYVIRDLDTDTSGNPIPGTWAVYYAYTPDPNGVPRRFRKSKQSINGTTVIGLDFLLNGPFNSGQGFDGLEISGENIVNM